MSIYDEKCIKARVTEFDGVTKTNVLGDKILDNFKPDFFLLRKDFVRTKTLISEH